MSIKWYEEHVESIIRQNQQLKFAIKKLANKDVTPSTQISLFFRNIFPDIPCFSSEDFHNKSFADILDYYAKAITIWMKKEKAKMDFLINNNESLERQILVGSTKIVNLRLNQRNGRCIYCDLERPSFKMQNRVEQLQKKVKELIEQLKSLQENQEKYLGEIAHLRSITKKLQFQLSQKVLMQGKYKSSYLQKSKKNEQQMLKLKREVCIWRSEYQRIWRQQQHMDDMVTSKNDCESSYLNNESKIQSSSTNSHIWIIRNHDFEQEYVVEEGERNKEREEH